MMGVINGTPGTPFTNFYSNFVFVLNVKKYCI